MVNMWKWGVQRISLTNSIVSLTAGFYSGMQVFCSKQQPRCGACPLQGMCEYALHKGPRLELPGEAPGEAAAAATTVAAAAGQSAGAASVTASATVAASSAAAAVEDLEDSVQVLASYKPIPC